MPKHRQPHATRASINPHPKLRPTPPPLCVAPPANVSEWEREIRYLRNEGCELARKLSLRRLKLIWWVEKRAGRVLADPMTESRVEARTLKLFVDGVAKQVNISTATLYRWIKIADDLVKKLGLDTMNGLVGTVIGNDDSMLAKLTKVRSPEQAQAIVDSYVEGGGKAVARKALSQVLATQEVEDLQAMTETPGLGGTLGPVDGFRNKVYFGNVFDRIGELPNKVVQTCITSPPFFRQRHYGSWRWFGGAVGCEHDKAITHGAFRKSAPRDIITSNHDSAAEITHIASEAGATVSTYECSKCGAWLGEVGQEPTLKMYLGHLVELYREIHRVLRDDGVVWIEIGDKMDDQGYMMVPERLAIALGENGWIVRAVSIWNKGGSGMPETVRDRSVRNYSTIYMLSKERHYYYDVVGVMEPAVGGTHSGIGDKIDAEGSGNRNNNSFTESILEASAGKRGVSVAHSATA